MRIIPTPPGPNGKGKCCGSAVALCFECPHRKVRKSDPDTSRDAAEYMSRPDKARVERQKIILVYYKTGKELNPWEMMCQSEGTISPDSCYWHRVGDLRKLKQLELVRDRLGNVVTRHGPSTRGQRVYRITQHGELVARYLTLGA